MQTERQQRAGRCQPGPQTWNYSPDAMRDGSDDLRGEYNRYALFAFDSDADGWLLGWLNAKRVACNRPAQGYVYVAKYEFHDRTTTDSDRAKI